MAEVTIPNQRGEMVKIELNPRGSGSAEWCGKHAPAKPGLCHIHSVHFHEIHDDEIQEIFGVPALFYCPEFGCDVFDYDKSRCCSRRGHDNLTEFFLSDRHRGEGQCDSPTMVERRIILGQFVNAARLRILFLKQHQMVEKLGLREVEKK